MSSHRVLVVEDDRSLADVLAYNLRRAGYEVLGADEGHAGLRTAQLHVPQVVILDVMLPGLDGHEICRRLRSDPKTRDVLILMLTAKTDEIDQVVGFSVGADDYVTKPFSVKVLLERVKALLRRRSAGQSADDDVIASQGLILDRQKHQATLEGSPLTLTPSEFRLLETIMRRPGRVFDRSELIAAALGADSIVTERTIDVHVRSLRRKMEAAAELIETVRGVGYRFREPLYEESSA